MYVIPNPEGLKPCRVCGSEEREVSPCPGRNERTPGFHIRCKVCGSIVIGLTSDEARILWNGENANPDYSPETRPEEEGWYLVEWDDYGKLEWVPMYWDVGWNEADYTHYYGKIKRWRKMI
jgi:hypothetical protein